MVSDPAEDPSLALISRLHAVFDAQVANYGAYNLVYAHGTATHTDSSVGTRQGEDQNHFILGYRRRPAELIVAPFSPDTLSSTGLPIALDNTNTILLRARRDGSVSLATVSGSAYHLELPGEVELPLGEETLALKQEFDVEDLRAFVTDHAT